MASLRALAVLLLCCACWASPIGSATAALHCPPSNFSNVTDGHSLQQALVVLARKLRIPDPEVVISNARQIALDLGSKKAILYASGVDRSPMLRRIMTMGIKYEPYGLESLPPLNGDILDIGSHIGTTAISLALLHPQVTVHAFEPAPLNFFFLAWNIAANGLAGRVIPRNLAFNRDATPIRLDYSPDDSTSTRARAFGKSKGRLPGIVHFVPAVRLQTFLAACGIGTRGVPFVKLDCEGCEYDLVPDNEQFFLKTAERLRGELHACLPGSCRVSKARVRQTETTLCARFAHTREAHTVHNLHCKQHWDGVKGLPHRRRSNGAHRHLASTLTCRRARRIDLYDRYMTGCWVL